MNRLPLADRLFYIPNRKHAFDCALLKRPVQMAIGKD